MQMRTPVRRSAGVPPCLGDAAQPPGGLRDAKERTHERTGTVPSATARLEVGDELPRHDVPAKATAEGRLGAPTGREALGAFPHREPRLATRRRQRLRLILDPGDG